MSFDIIIGAQSGNEGKSKFSRFYSTRWKHYDAVIKVGGYCSNNFYDEKLERIVTSRMIPAASNESDDIVYIFPRQTYVDLELLKKEAEERQIDLDRIIIDNDAVVIRSDLSESLARTVRDNDIGKIKRTDVSKLLEEWNDSDILVEGQGGYVLGADICTRFPFICPMVFPTMTASGIASLLNVGPGDIGDVILVSRLEYSYLKYNDNILNDIDHYLWENILKGEFNDKVLEEVHILYNLPGDVLMRYVSNVSKAILANSPDLLVLNFLDLIDSKEGKDTEDFTDAQMDAVNQIEEELGVTIDFIGNGETRLSHLDDSEDEVDTAMIDAMDFISKYGPSDKENGVNLILPSSRII